MLPLARSLAASLGVTALLCVVAFPASASVAGTCDYVAAATGDDTAAGTAQAPFRTADKLAGALKPGQTGCVRGTIEGDVNIEVPGVTVTSEPGQRGTLTSGVVVRADADHVTISDLDLHASGYKWPSPVIFGDDAVISGNDITNDKAPMLCMLLGAFNHNGNAVTERALIIGNRIHDCGRGDNHQHGLYLENTRDVRVIGNDFIDNADRAIQLYPSAQGTLIEGNVIDGNGEGIIFSGLAGVPSNDNVVRHNVLTGPKIRSVVESWYPDDTPQGTGNVVEDNCVWTGTSRKPIDLTNGGFVARNNVEADPQYVDGAKRDVRLRDGGPCADILRAGRAGTNLPVPGATVASPAPAVAPPTLAATPAAPSPIVVDATRRGSELRVRVEISQDQPVTGTRIARVQYRTSTRAPWKPVAVGKVSKARAFVASRKVKAARNQRLHVRAVLVRNGRPTAIASKPVRRLPHV